jgi:hypothetical protein
MRWINAIKDGLFCGRRGILGACIFYLEALLLSSLALAPLASGLHRVLDEAPTAAPLARGVGVDRLLETAINQPGLWSAGFGNMGVAFLLHLGLALLITAGATGLIARAPEGSPWRAFWREASGLFFPFAGLFLMSLLLLVAVGILPSLLVAGLGKALKESVSPTAFWGVLSGWVIVFLLLLAVFKGATGFTQARRALGGGAEGLGRCFLAGAKFSLKKFVPSFGFTALFLVLRMATFSGFYWAVAPGYGTAGSAFVSALLLQLAFAAQAYIRVAEIAAQVSYLKASGGAYVPPAERAQPPVETPAEPEASPEELVTA